MKIALAVTLASMATWAGCQTQPVELAMSLGTETRETTWETPMGAGVQIDTDNYRIYSTSRDRSFRQTLAGFMEASYRNYLRLTNLPNRKFAQPLPMYMMGSRDEWASLTKSVVKEDVNTYLGIENGGYCYQDVCVFWRMGTLGTLQVAAHEGMHQFLHHRLKDQLPMWLEEGLCTQAEGYDIQGSSVAFSPLYNHSRMGNLETSLTSGGLWLPVDKLLPMDAGDAVGAYAEQATSYYGQLWALVRFIRTNPQYRAGLERLVADAEAGRFNEALNLPPQALAELRLRGKIYNQTVSETLFRHYICDDMPRFNKEYRQFALKITGLEG